MPDYNYTGPLSAVTLTTESGTTEVQLTPGGTVSMPEGHDYVATLKAMGYLTEVPAQATKPSKPATKKETESNAS